MLVSAINSVNTQKADNQSFTALPAKYKLVADELVRGPHPHISDLVRLKKEGVNQIFDFRHDSMRGYKWVERLACKIMGIDYQRRQFSFFNKRPKLEDFESVTSAVAENAKKGGRSLFHCNSGSHRTALFSTFFAITKGKPLEECIMHDSNYMEKAKDAVNNEIINSRFFTRNRVKPESWNPIRHFRNQFNNKVVKNTGEALKEFFEIIHYQPS